MALPSMLLSDQLSIVGAGGVLTNTRFSKGRVRFSYKSHAHFIKNYSHVNSRAP